MIELGETFQEAARRELGEECGVEAEIGRVLKVADIIVVDKSSEVRFHYVLIYVLAEHVGGTPSPGSDACEVRWIRHEVLSTLDMHPIARQAVQEAFEAIGR